MKIYLVEGEARVDVGNGYPLRICTQDEFELADDTDVVLMIDAAMRDMFEHGKPLTYH